MKLTITYDGEKLKFNTGEADSAEVIVLLHETSKAFCESLSMDHDLALASAYTLLQRGELFQDLKEEKEYEKRN